MKNKNFIKSILLCLSFILCVSVFIGCNKTIKTSTNKKNGDKRNVLNKKSKDLLTDSDKKLLKRHYNTFNEDEENQVANIVGVKYPKMSKEEQKSIYAGYWAVGCDIAPSQYKISTNSKHGKIIVINVDNGEIKHSSSIGSDLTKNEVVLNLHDKEILKIESLDKVKLMSEQ